MGEVDSNRGILLMKNDPDNNNENNLVDLLGEPDNKI